MSMNEIARKLRKNNQSHYTLLIFCTVLSVLLVTSYSLMYLSPTVQTILPTGGDSRKQASLVFAIAILGCAIFTTYASSLFFKYKSREYGIFMALGETKKNLKLLLTKELLVLVPLCALTGLALSIPTSFCIWKLFQFFIVDTNSMAYALGWIGFLYGLAFCLFVILSISLTGAAFIKRSNIIEIIYDSRKSETLQEVKSSTGLVGWILAIGGVVLGYAVPILSAQLFQIVLPFAWNGVFVLTPIGIYLIMLHTIVHVKKGKNSKKYYQNIISTNMMRFSGKQTVKNMCVIALLICCALFSAFYMPSSLVPSLVQAANSPVDYYFFYKASENQIQQEEIRALAEKYKVPITSYEEMTSIALLASGIERDYVKNKLVHESVDKMAYEEFFSESDFNRTTGQNLHVASGTYIAIVANKDAVGYWTKNDDLYQVTHPVTHISEPITFGGIVEYRLFTNIAETKFVISDEDYNRLAQDLPKNRLHQHIFFNVENPKARYAFAVALKNKIVLHSSADVGITSSYNEYKQKIAAEKGAPDTSEYFTVKLDVDNSQLFLNWKYYPRFAVLDKQDVLKNTAVYLMLFLYISIICFVTLAVIAYTRSITVGLDNITLFHNLKKLGANNAYIESALKKQLIKIFLYPTLVGSSATYLFYCMIFYFNDGKIMSTEFTSLVVNAFIVAVAALLMYAMFRFSLSKVKKLIAL